MIRAALVVRFDIMFSGNSGAVVKSGITSDAATADAPTYGLSRAAHEVVFDARHDTLFDQHAEHRPCGVLDRYEAIGMLVGDALGLPLMPRRPYGLAVGNKVRKVIKEIPSETEKAKIVERQKEVSSDDTF